MNDDDLDFDPEDSDKERHAAGIAAFFGGDELSPVTASTWAAMEAAGIRIIFGDSSRATFDCAAFCLLHSADYEEQAHAKRAAFRPGFSEYVMEWLDTHPEMHSEFDAIAAKIRERMDEYAKQLTRKTPVKTSGQKGVAIRTKKNGRRTG
jgi:hypothetical protein